MEALCVATLALPGRGRLARGSGRNGTRSPTQPSIRTRVPTPLRGPTCGRVRGRVPCPRSNADCRQPSGTANRAYPVPLPQIGPEQRIDLGFARTSRQAHRPANLGGWRSLWWRKSYRIRFERFRQSGRPKPSTEPPLESATPCVRCPWMAFVSSWTFWDGWLTRMDSPTALSRLICGHLSPKCGKRVD